MELLVFLLACSPTTLSPAGVPKRSKSSFDDKNMNNDEDEVYDLTTMWQCERVIRSKQRYRGGISKRA
jgi:hypothetical protein